MRELAVHEQLLARLQSGAGEDGEAGEGGEAESSIRPGYHMAPGSASTTSPWRIVFSVTTCGSTNCSK